MLSAFFTCAIITLESTHLLRPALLYCMSDLLTQDGAAKRIGDFTKATTTLNGFFLGLFTSATMGRWFQLWNDGILKIFRSTARISTMLSCDCPETWVERGPSGTESA